MWYFAQNNSDINFGGANGSINKLCKAFVIYWVFLEVLIFMVVFSWWALGSKATWLIFSAEAFYWLRFFDNLHYFLWNLFLATIRKRNLPEARLKYLLLMFLVYSELNDCIP